MGSLHVVDSRQRTKGINYMELNQLECSLLS